MIAGQKRVFLWAAAALAVMAGALSTGAALAQGGPVPGFIQIYPRLTPGGTTNARPACHVERRYLCKIGNGSCSAFGVSCASNETRVQIGVSVYCDRWAC